MNDIDIAEDEPRISFARRLWRAWQWTLAVFLGLSVLMFILISSQQLRAPGAPVTLFWGAIALVVLTTAALSPPAFFRLPRFGKVGAYVAAYAALMMLSNALGGMAEAFEQTPEGARIAAQERQEAEAAEQKRAAEQKYVDAEAVANQLREIDQQQQACLSWGGDVRGLSDAVRKDLHDPSSFEHVETRFIAPDVDRLNVLMTFRATNGFGAIRTATVRAQMDPASCDILKVGEVEPL